MAEEKIEKGVISEEALEEIAGGFKVAGYDISKETIKKFCNEHKKDLIFTGIEAGTIAIGTIAAIKAGFIGYIIGYKSNEKWYVIFNELLDDSSEE